MSYTSDFSSVISYMTTNSVSEPVSAGLFDIALTKQAVFHSASSLSPIGGASVVVAQISFSNDGDGFNPIASIRISSANTASSRAGIQISPSTSTGFRLATSSSPLIPTSNPISLVASVNDLGDIPLMQKAIFSILPIKG